MIGRDVGAMDPFGTWLLASSMQSSRRRTQPWTGETASKPGDRDPRVGAAERTGATKVHGEAAHPAGVRSA